MERFSKKIVLAYRLILAVASVLLAIALVVWLVLKYPREHQQHDNTNKKTTEATLWQAPDPALMAKEKDAQLLAYGKDLIAHTARYLGPEGSVTPISNGMNCQNCHLDAGTKPFGNNYGSVASLYPKFRARSGGLESIEKRVNDCLQRSLNGQPLDSLSKEMRAMVLYIQWLGKDVPKGKKAAGSGLVDMAYLERPADPARGKVLFESKCRVCHGKNGEGMKVPPSHEYLYPPVWGDHSFNTAAGLYRLSSFAKYIKANMPQGATYDKPQLSEEEAWDIAAYAVSLPRPAKTFVGDWPKIATKPVDHPFGPYQDTFPERQHKYGPFKPILQAASAQ